MAKIDDRALRRMQAFDDNEDGSESDQGSVEWESASEMESDVGDYNDSEEGEGDDDNAAEDDEDEEEDEEESEDEDEDDDDSDSEDSEDSDEDSDDSESDSDSNERKLRELQNNLSQIPFDKLAEIQQKVGIKAFQKTLRGQSKGQGAAKSSKSKKPAYSDDSDDDESDSDDSDDGQPSVRSSGGKMDRLLAMGKEKRGRKSIAKRDNKNRPMEVTSKKPVGRFRQVVEVPTAKRRDPRFDSLSGKLNEDLFERSYDFLKDYQQDEMKKLRELIKKEKNQELKEKMQNELSRMVDRQSTEAARKRKTDIKREHKRKERDLIAQGKKPFFLKKADQKKLALIEKFESLNPKALSKAMERRRKRNSAKEKTKVLGVKRRRVD
ncbi:rRNA biogenesis protein rrp36 [Actinomortierella ambigua]|nr:rRNA biogenesis protein rrp36 [Actinomortierella ambigua]